MRFYNPDHLAGLRHPARQPPRLMVTGVNDLLSLLLRTRSVTVAAECDPGRQSRAVTRRRMSRGRSAISPWPPNRMPQSRHVPHTWGRAGSHRACPARTGRALQYLIGHCLETGVRCTPSRPSGGPCGVRLTLARLVVIGTRGRAHTAKPTRAAHQDADARALPQPA